jgi:hypothetical protein
MAIPIIDGFEVNKPEPIDSRMRVKTLTERNAIPALVRYDGLAVYVIEDEGNYQLRGGILNIHWHPMSSGTSLRLVPFPINAESPGKLGDIALREDWIAAHNGLKWLFYTGVEDYPDFIE